MNNLSIKFRRDESSEWEKVNPVLAKGQIGIDLSLSKIKIGDGITSWNGLDFSSSDEVIAHLISGNLII